MAVSRYAFATHQGLGRKYEMATAYTSLGHVHRALGDLPQAEAPYKKALLLFQEMNAMPKIAMVQGLLEQATHPRVGTEARPPRA